MFEEIEMVEAFEMLEVFENLKPETFQTRNLLNLKPGISYGHFPLTIF